MDDYHLMDMWISAQRLGRGRACVHEDDNDGRVYPTLKAFSRESTKVKDAPNSPLSFLGRVPLSTDKRLGV